MRFNNCLAIACACLTATAAQAAEPSLDAVRNATERFRDVNVAIAEGYVAPPGNACETAAHMGMDPSLGGMGVHYFRPDLLGITAVEPRVDGNGTHIDFSNPAILIYEPDAEGTLELVAVENLVFEKAWAAAGNTERPSFAGRQFDMMADDPSTEADEGHMFEPHYDLHVWLHRDNPNGMFAQFNPTVTCTFARQDPEGHHAHNSAGSSSR